MSVSVNWNDRLKCFVLIKIKVFFTAESFFNYAFAYLRVVLKKAKALCEGKK